MTICLSTCWVLEYYHRRRRSSTKPPPVSNYYHNRPQNVTEIMIYNDAKLASENLIAMIWEMLCVFQLYQFKSNVCPSTFKFY